MVHPEEHLLIAGLVIEGELCREGAARVCSPALTSAGQNFAQNIQTLASMLSLPWVLLMHAQLPVFELFATTLALIKMPTGGRYGSDDAVRTQVDAEARRVFLEEMRRPETPGRVEENATRLLTDVLTRHEDVLLAMRALLASGVSAAWTAFECLASDLWIAALNERPQAGTRALAELPGDANDDLTRKSISVRLLQKYGLDLRNTMGSLLFSKFDFTGVNGIRRAYEAALGEPIRREAVFENRDLSVLEATRHVIVHRGGEVDEEFLRRTNQNLPVGRPLPVDGAMVSRLANAAVHAGCHLLRVVDNWVASTV